MEIKKKNERGEVILARPMNFDGKTIEGKVVIPEGVTHIGANAFYGCVNITEVIMPDSVRFIDEYAFANCEKLERIKISANVTDIGFDAFRNCRNLEEIVAENMLDPYPGCIYCIFDEFNRRRGPTNRRIVYQDEEFIIPTAFPKVRLNSGFSTSWKTALTLGFLAHPELYGAYDHNKKSEKYQGVNPYEEDISYANYAMRRKKQLVKYIFQKERPEMLRFYAWAGGITKRNLLETFIKPAEEARATKCLQFLDDWVNKRIELETIVPREEIHSSLPGNISSEEALFNWTYQVNYFPEPMIQLTQFKAKRDEKYGMMSVMVPEYIDNIPVRTLGRHVFIAYIFEKYSKIKHIYAGNNLNNIRCEIPNHVGIIIHGKKNSYAQRFAEEEGIKFEEISADSE